MHAANKKVFNEKWCCGFALNRAVTTVSSFTVLIIGKVKCMKTQSLEQRRFSWSRPFWWPFKKWTNQRNWNLCASVNGFPIRVFTATSPSATTSLKDMVLPNRCPLLTKSLKHYRSITTIKYILSMERLWNVLSGQNCSVLAWPNCKLHNVS